MSEAKFTKSSEDNKQELNPLMREAIHHPRHVLKSHLKSIKARDLATYNHCMRTMRLSEFLVSSIISDDDFSFSDKKCQLIYPFAASDNKRSNLLKIVKVGAALHDIGKIAWPDAVLKETKKQKMRTNGQTDNIEKELLGLAQDMHSKEGRYILDDIVFFEYDEANKLVLEIICSHHEPRLAKGNNSSHENSKLSVATRVVQLADVYDAVFFPRPYHTKPRYFVDAIGLMDFECEKGKIDQILLDKFKGIKEEELRNFTLQIEEEYPSPHGSITWSIN